jgi:hypothetical protein
MSNNALSLAKNKTCTCTQTHTHTTKKTKLVLEMAPFKLTLRSQKDYMVLK